MLEALIYQNVGIFPYAAQWINCDVRALDLSVVGKYGVIMADPPCDIMELPYGTLTDEEMLALNVGELATDDCLLSGASSAARRCSGKRSTSYSGLSGRAARGTG